MELLKKANKHILTFDKNELKEFGVKGAETDLERAETDASELMISAKKAIAILEGYISGVLDSVHDECHLHNKGTIELFGSTIALGSTGDRWDFEQDAEFSRIKEELKEREKWLKEASKSKEEVVINGAVVVPVPLKAASREIIRVKL